MIIALGRLLDTIRRPDSCIQPFEMYIRKSLRSLLPFIILALPISYALPRRTGTKPLTLEAAQRRDYALPLVYESPEEQNIIRRFVQEKAATLLIMIQGEPSAPQ